MKNWVLLSVFLCLPALGQSNGIYKASTYAYTTYVTQGNASPGSTSIGAQPTAFAQGIPFLPYNTNASITLSRNAGNAETIVVSSLANCYPNSLTCTLSGIFTYKHIAGETIQSGTFGLQEALNVAVAAGSGTVLIDASWQGPAGTSLITAAKGSNAVMIQDNRNPSGATFYQWNGSAYAATGGGGAVSSVFGRTGAVVAQSGDYSCAQVTGCNSSPGIQSINGDTTSAQHMAASGTGLSVSTVGGTTTYTLTGGGLSGGVNTGAANQAGCYPSAGTTIGPCPNVYVLNPAMTASQIATLLGGLAGTNTYVIPAGTPQTTYNYNSQIPLDLRMGANWFQMPGVACDGRQSSVGVTITSGSNTSNVGASFTTADVGKTFFFYNRTGLAYGSTQSVWAAKLNGYTFPTATWSSNAPFSASTLVWYGTDNLAAVNAAMTQANSVFPLTIPTGCYMLVNGTIPWNNNQVIVGRHQAAGGFIGRPATDVIASTDTSGQSISSAGTGLKNFAIWNATEIDWALGYNFYDANGTLTVVPPVYRPLYDHTENAAHPLAPGWITGGKNGVASTTQNSAVICTPNAYAPPAVGQQIMFPYFSSIFTATVSSTGGSCAGGFTARTMSTPFPNTAAYTVAQAEWFTGSAIQSTTTTIPASGITYPLTIALTLSTNPVPGWPSNFPQTGHIKLCGSEFDYGGTTSTSIVLRKGPTTSNGCSGTTPIAPLNPCAAKNLFGSTSDQPWPVTPSINSGDSTPSGANWFPGGCGGNFGVAFPTANGNTYVGAGLVGGFLEDLNFQGTQGSNTGNTNNAGAIYIAGNNAPFSSHFENIISQNLEYGIVQGPASAGQHGVAAVGPTGIGNTWHNLWLFGAFPLAFVDFQGSNVTDMQMNSTEISPFDGSAIGTSTCLQVGFTLDEQTGGVVTSTSFDQFNTFECEPEGGSHAWVKPYVDIQGSHIGFDTANFEGVFNIFGGDHLHCNNCLLSFPTIDYGSNNDFGLVGGNAPPYITNVWDGTAQFYEWGKGAHCFLAAGNGPAAPCGASIVGGPQPYQITPWIWNNNGAFDASPMTTTGFTDPTALYWGASATCNIGGGGICHTKTFFGFNGYLYIGPFNWIANVPYALDATFKTVSGASSFGLVISAEDTGSGTCVSGGYTSLYSGTVTTTISFTPFTANIDFSGSKGCAIGVQFFNGSTTDTLVVDRFTLTPQVPWIRGPMSAPTYPGSCPAGTPTSAWLGDFSGFTYFCDGGTVKRVGIS